MNIILLNELVNKDGSRIKGDGKIDQDNNMTTSKITTDDFVHMTRQGISRYNNYGRVYYGEDDESKKDAKIPKEDRKKKKPQKPKIKQEPNPSDDDKEYWAKTKKASWQPRKKPKIKQESEMTDLERKIAHQQAMIDANNTPSHKRSYSKADKTRKKLKSESKNKMSSLIEDVFTKKDFDREFVKNGGNNMTTKEIGDLDSIRDTNPILIRKVGALVDIIEKNSTSGEEKAVILNHILNMDLTDIPQNHKEILKRKLG